MPVTHKEGDRYPLGPPRFTASLNAVAGRLKLPWKCYEVGLRMPLKPQLEFSAREHSKDIFPMSNLGEGGGLLIREAWFESTMGSQF